MELISNQNRPEDSEYEVQCMQKGVAELDIFPSIWGRKYIFIIAIAY